LINMKIFIDFDDVLFNTKSFIKDIKKLFYEFGIPNKIFDETYKSKRKSLKMNGKYLLTYDPSLQFEKIRNKLGLDTRPLEKEFYTLLKNAKRYVFKDACIFLENKNKNDLFILSFGTSNFQKEKIKNSGITKYFKKIIIISRETKARAIKEILEKQKLKNKEPVYFFDDREKFLEDVKTHLPFVKTFLVSRKEGRFGDKKTKCCDWKICDLKEAQKIIKNI
jgi:FMN phosphatase YigB (HAD superfamily)